MWQRLLFVPFLAVLAIVQSCFTISALWTTHFAVVIFLPAMIFGLGMSELQTWLTDRTPSRWPRVVAIAAGLIVIGAQLWSSVRYDQALARSGGASFHSAAIYQLSDSIRQRNEPVVALDWGIAAQLDYLSGGSVRVEELFGFEREADVAFRDQLRARFDQPALYITHAAGQESFPRRSAFLETVAESGRWAERVDTINTADNVPMFEVWRARLPGQ